VQPAVFLDRDNTLIHNDGDLGDPRLVKLVDGVPHGLRSLRQAGFHLVVVTNQAGVARGKFTEHDVDTVHQRIATMVDEVASGGGGASAAGGGSGLIDRFYYCPYHPEGTVAEYKRDHPWRKPHPGMILQAARDMGLDLSQSWLIGDQERDIAAGRAAGCRTVLVTRDRELAAKAGATAVVTDFSHAVEWILHHPPTSFNGAADASPPAPTWTGQGEVGPSPAARSAAAPAGNGETDRLRRAIADLTEELRSERQRRAEFTSLRMAAGIAQLLAIALAVLGLLQLGSADVFLKWMTGAILAQLLAMTLLLLDLKG
jgi:D-glycero-D-manno-heptose 1,7-bisphosphate phosphatase